MLCRFLQFSFLFLLSMAAMVNAAEQKETKVTLFYGECNNCAGFGRCMRVKSDSIGKYAVCEQATIYGCGFGEVGSRFYLPDSVGITTRSEVTETCGYIYTMDGRTPLQRDVIYIDLTYKGTKDQYCMPTKDFATSMLEANRVKCESDEGSKFFGEIKEKDGQWCVSGRCNACGSKWQDDLVNEAKQECCDKGLEPETDRGVCLNPAKNPDKGIEGSAIYLLPKCTDKVPNYESGNSFCDAPSSSSSREEAYSSSRQEASSSSMEESSSSSLVGCFKENHDAQEALQEEIFKCDAIGGSSNFVIDSRNCLVGSCEVPEKSSSSEAVSSSSMEPSSSSSDGGSNSCPVSASRLLQKPEGYYDDWVYLGKETYGSRHVKRNSVKPGTTFFDALGRAYKEMKAKIQYYVFKNAINRNEFDVPLEFEVFGKIVKDSEGNDIQVFVKEDKPRMLRRDSSFYADGEWEVFEFDDLKNETRFKSSYGIKSLRKYKDERLIERYMTDKNGDTLTSEKYEWSNGRLVSLVANGVIRKYIYGKTLKDTVKVIPSDEGFNYHSGYNGTVGKIPDESEPEYKIFARAPYGHVAFMNDENELSVAYLAAKKSAYENSNSFNFLGKITTTGCVVEEAGMPKAQCVRFTKNDFPDNEEYRLFGYPSKDYNPIYGLSDFKLSLKSECKCNSSGKYQHSFIGNTINEKIEVFLSRWKYNYEEESWYEHCRFEENLYRTYNHEVQHIINSRRIAATLSAFTDKDSFDTKKECEKTEEKEYKNLIDKWDEWSGFEKAHVNPSSPVVGSDRYDYICD